MRRSQSQYTTKDFLDVATCGLSPSKRRGILFAMLAAHIDDSGSHGQGPVFVLGGYVANVTQWKKFSEQWQMALDLAPKLEVVKIQHALRLEEGWGRMRAKQRDERMKRFASIVHKHVMFSVIISSPWDGLRRIKKEFFSTGKFPPYLLLVNMLMAVVVGRLKEARIREMVSFVFDEQGALSKASVEQFIRLRESLPAEAMAMIAGPPHFQDDKKVLPLQAAHNIAWLHRRFAAENNVTVGDLAGWQPKQPYLRKLRKIPTLYAYCPYELLHEVFTTAILDSWNERR